MALLNVSCAVARDSGKVLGKRHPGTGRHIPNTILAVEPDFALGDRLVSLSRESDDTTSRANGVSVENRSGEIGAAARYVARGVKSSLGSVLSV